MEQRTHIPKLQISGLRRPQKISSTVTNPLSEIGPASNRRVLLRRSKSVQEISSTRRPKTSDETTIEKPLKCPVLRPLQTDALKTKSVSDKQHRRFLPDQNLTSKKLTRRSMSVEELNVQKKKNLDGFEQRTSKMKIQQLTNIHRQTASATAPKRKVGKVDEAIKPAKVAKKAKIPDWDYKGRFNQLQEMFTTLKEKYNENCNKEEEYRTQVSDLNLRFNTVATECHTAKVELERIRKSNDVFSNENIKLKEENISLKYKLGVLEKELSELKEKHDELSANYAELELSYNNKLDSNKELTSNLESERIAVRKLVEENAFLKAQIYEGDVLRRTLHNTIQDLKGNIRVFCRVRPPASAEEEERLQCNITFLDERTIEIRKSRESVHAISGKAIEARAEFTLDKVFEPQSSQEEVFEDLAQLVQSALDGYDVCVFAYGQTGSGKTYTMLGDGSSKQTGMIPRTVDLIFHSIRDLSRTGWTYEVGASFLEIYNETIKDLLNPTSAQSLEIRHNEGKGTTVTNLSISQLNSPDELKALMKRAHKNRATAATDFNVHSSRSHAVTKIYLRGVNQEMNVSYAGSINLVDLAGSESAKTSSSERLAETKNINKSLSALGNVMLALYNKEKHIPYRCSKLTYLLQSSLGGNSKTLMLVNIAPFEECYSESISSLRFASKVKEVKTIAKKHKHNLAPPTISTKN